MENHTDLIAQVADMGQRLQFYRYCYFLQKRTLIDWNLLIHIRTQKYWHIWREKKFVFQWEIHCQNKCWIISQTKTLGSVEGKSFLDIVRKKTLYYPEDMACNITQYHSGLLAFHLVLSLYITFAYVVNLTVRWYKANCAKYVSYLTWTPIFPKFKCDLVAR